MYKETIRQFENAVLKAGGIEELNQLRNIAFSNTKKIANSMHSDNAKKYEEILKKQIDLSKMRIEEERRRLDNIKFDIANLVKDEAGKIDTQKNEANMEIAKIYDEACKQVKGGGNE